MRFIVPLLSTWAGRPVDLEPHREHLRRRSGPPWPKVIQVRADATCAAAPVTPDAGRSLDFASFDLDNGATRQCRRPGESHSLRMKEARQMTAVQTRDFAPPRTVAPSAAVWIDGRVAIVARMGDDGVASTAEIERGSEQEAAYLALVVRAIGDRERVLILGPSSVRLALEREYVAIYHRPERLVDVEPAGPMDAAALVERLRGFAA
jgi:hypothetical protein